MPFDTYFDVASLEKCHRVVTMDNFFRDFAASLWPTNKRVSFCYTERRAIGDQGSGGGACNAKNGNPFGPFWDTFGVDFVASETYGPLHYDVQATNVADDWNDRYPPASWPVLAFTGAPASYPVQKQNVGLHKYLNWNSDMVKKADDYVRNNLPKGPFIGIHLRNGIDWVSTCSAPD